jgi:hypothetical protein
MSFGDGIAQSIGTVGSSVICLIANGIAVVNSNVNTDIIVVSDTINDSDLCFEKSLMANNELLNLNRIVINSETQIVASHEKKPTLFWSYNKNKNSEASVTVDNSAQSSIVMKATCQVIDKNDTNKYIMQYLIMDDTRVYSYNASVTCYKQSIIINKPKLVFSKRQVHENQYYPLGVEKDVMVYDIDDSRLKINYASIFVENRVPVIKSTSTLIQPVTVTIEDYKPPAIGVIAFSGGGGLKGFRLVVQKYSYFEQYLSFTKGTVTDITALPQGMFFENGYLKGAPTVAGNFAINIKMDDNTALSGLLIVTQVPRNL